MTSITARQDAKIDFTSETKQLPADHNLPSWSAVYKTDDTIRPFTPITNDKLKSYDGKSRKIIGLTENVGDSNAGLFATFKGDTLKGIYLSGAHIKGKACVGGIAGEIRKACTISDCRLYMREKDAKGIDIREPADVPDWLHGKYAAGGLVGVSKNKLTIEKSMAATVVISDDTEAGGLVGAMEGDDAILSIDRSYADCYIKGGTTSEKGMLGGLVGDGNSISITNSYVAGFAYSGEANTTKASGITCGTLTRLNNTYTAFNINGISDKVEEANSFKESYTIASQINDDKVKNVYYVFSGADDSDDIEDNENIKYISPSNLQESSNIGNMFDKDTDNNAVFEILGNSRNTAYFLPKGKSYPFPVLAWEEVKLGGQTSIMHYGDWADRTELYIEYYSDNDDKTQEIQIEGKSSKRLFYISDGDKAADQNVLNDDIKKCVENMNYGAPKSISFYENGEGTPIKSYENASVSWSLQELMDEKWFTSSGDSSGAESNTARLYFQWKEIESKGIPVYFYNIKGKNSELIGTLYALNGKYYEDANCMTEFTGSVSIDNKINRTFYGYYIDGELIEAKKMTNADGEIVYKADQIKTTTNVYGRWGISEGTFTLPTDTSQGYMMNDKGKYVFLDGRVGSANIAENAEINVQLFTARKSWIVGDSGDLEKHKYSVAGGAASFDIDNVTASIYSKENVSGVKGHTVSPYDYDPTDEAVEWDIEFMDGGTTFFQMFCTFEGDYTRYALFAKREKGGDMYFGLVRADKVGSPKDGNYINTTFTRWTIIGEKNKPSSIKAGLGDTRVLAQWDSKSLDIYSSKIEGTSYVPTYIHSIKKGEEIQDMVIKSYDDEDDFKSQFTTRTTDTAKTQMRFYKDTKTQ